jgi:para-nitrobenzyl esterase
MVWVHGGGNVAGSGVEALFNGEALARRGVVVVNINYRLGVLGFFAHPELTKESPLHAAGNYGLADQLLALRWVQANIAAFGGDPRNVTLFGESAGANDVNALIASPLSKGLFARVIAQSGPIGTQLSLAEAEQRGVALAAKLDIRGERAIAALRALSDTDLMEKAPQGGIGLNVDGWILPEQASKIYAEGRQQKVALLIGSNSQEMQPRGTPGDVRPMISERYGPLAQRALAAYGVSGPVDPQPDPENGTVLLQFTTDNSFRCGSVQELIWHTAAGNAGFQYQFSRTVHGKEALGAPHASEIPFIFGTLPVWQRMRNYDESDRQYASLMQEYWTNFAKTGDPNGGHLVKWPRFDSRRRAYIAFTDAGPVVREGLRRDVCDLFMENQKRQAR